MNLIVVALIAISGLSGAFLDSQGTHKLASWAERSLIGGLIHAQAGEAEKTPEPTKSPIPKERPLGDDQQNWGAMIVFAGGITMFIVAYIVFRQTPAPKKKRKIKF